MAKLETRCETRGDKADLVKRLERIHTMAESLSDEIYRLTEDFAEEDFVLSYGSHKYDCCKFFEMVETIDEFMEITSNE